MMEVQRARKPVVAADHAPTAGVLDQLKFLASPPLDYALLAALHASVVATPLKNELRLTVRRAPARGDSVGRNRRRSPLVQLELPHPVPDGRQADAELTRYRPKTQPPCEKSFELLPVDALAWRVTVAVDSSEPVPPQPVGDRRRAAPVPPAYVLK